MISNFFLLSFPIEECPPRENKHNTDMTFSMCHFMFAEPPVDQLADDEVQTTASEL